MKKVSFYIPTLNSSKTIKLCLESVLNQSYEIKEILVIDGKSTDDTLKIVKDIVKKTKIPLRIVKQKKNGLANARNLALKKGEYEYIASIDADCIADKNWLKLLMINLKDENVIGTGGDLIEKYCLSLSDRWRATHMKQTWGNKKVHNPKFLFGSNTLFKKYALKKIGGYNERYTTNYEDVDISKRLLKEGKSLIYDSKTVCYHQKKDNIISLLNTYYNWTFYSYPLPNTLINLITRLFVFNPYKVLKLILKDMIKIRLSFIGVDLLVYFFSSYKDIRYYLKKW